MRTLQRRRAVKAVVSLVAIALTAAAGTALAANASSFVLLQGSVKAQAGGPVRSALVVPVSLDRPAKAIPEIASYTDSKGQYTWHLRPGRYRITVRPPNHEPLAKIVVLKCSTTTLNFVLP